MKRRRVKIRNYRLQFIYIKSDKRGAVQPIIIISFGFILSLIVTLLKQWVQPFVIAGTVNGLILFIHQSLLPLLFVMR